MVLVGSSSGTEPLKDKKAIGPHIFWRDRIIRLGQGEQGLVLSRALTEGVRRLVLFS